MLSRMTNFFNKRIKDENGNLKQGDEYKTLFDHFGYKEIGILTRWEDGMLNDNGDSPAVEFMDAHIEHFRKGLLHNEKVDDNGFLKPAIRADYGKKLEYYLNGKQVDHKENPING